MLERLVVVCLDVHGLRRAPVGGGPRGMAATALSELRRRCGEDRPGGGLPHPSEAHGGVSLPECARRVRHVGREPRAERRLSKKIFALTTVIASAIPRPLLAQEVRTFGVGTGGGFGWVAVTATSGGSTASGSTTAPSYPSLELQFFNDKGGSVDVSLPVGNIIDAAANGNLTIGAAVFYTPEFSTGSVRGIVSPGLRFGYASQGGASAMLVDVGLRAGVEFLTEERRVGLKLLCVPALDAGAAWGSGNSSVGLVGFSLGALVVVSVYGTHPAVAEEKGPTTAPPAEAETAPATDEVDAAIVAIQKHPKFPELGATRAEARAVCEHERGAWIDRGEKVGCQILRANVFACEVDEGAMRACTHWKLGADLTDERDTISETIGKPSSVGRGDRGFRVYTWETPTKTTTLSGYPAGVIVTEASATDDTAPKGTGDAATP